MNQSFYRVIQECQNKADWYASNRIFVFTNWISYIGNTSTIWKTNICDYTTGDILGECEMLGVIFDLKQSKTVKTPDEVKKKLILGRNEATRITSVPQPHGEVYTVSVTPQYSDIDQFGHVTNVQYSKFFVDCAAMAIQDGFYKEIDDHLGSLMLEKFTNHFLSEAKIGDILLCTTWQDDYDLQLLYFSLSKSHDGIVVSTGAMKLG